MRCVSRFRLSGRMTMRMLLPRTESVSSSTVFCPFIVIFTFLTWVFMATSTPARVRGAVSRARHALADGGN